MIKANPISANTAAIAAKMMTAMIEMTSAFSHPQSKKCFASASQSISWMPKAMMPEKRAPRSVPIKVPRIIIQTASMNFALSFPTITLPDSQRTGDSMMVFTMMCMTSISKLTAKSISSFLIQVD